MSSDDPNSYEVDDNYSIVAERLPSTNNIIRGQKDSYAIGKKISSGKYGAVYEVFKENQYVFLGFTA